MRTTCSRCSKALNVPDSMAGREVVCAACRNAERSAGSESAAPAKAAPGGGVPLRRPRTDRLPPPAKCSYCGKFLLPGQSRCSCRDGRAAADAATAAARSAESVYGLGMRVLGVALLALGGLGLLSTIVAIIVALARQSGEETGSWLSTRGIQLWVNLAFNFMLWGACAGMGFCAFLQQNWVNWATAGLAAGGGLWLLILAAAGNGRIFVLLLLVPAAILALAVNNILKYRRITAGPPPAP